MKLICTKREGKTVYIGITWRDIKSKNGEKSAVRMIYEITERTTTADGQMLFMPDTEIICTGNLYKGISCGSVQV